MWGSPVRVGGAGLYLVELPAPLPEAPVDAGLVRAWLERVPTLRLDGEVPTPHVLAARLRAFWLPAHSVLYVGRTAKSIGGRLAALYATPLGDPRPHAGGHWLKTLRGYERTRIWWAATDAPEEYEDALLARFAESVDPETAAGLHDPQTVLPFANIEAGARGPKAHGISGALLPGEARGAVDPAPTVARGTTGSSGRPGARRALPRASARRPSASAPGRAPASARARTSGRAGGPSSATTSPRGPGDSAYVSTEGVARLRDELQELVEVRRPQIIARVKAARELGDLRENADYEAARNEQSFAEGRIQALEGLLKTAVVIEENTGGGRVVVGSTVVVESDGERDSYTIVGSTEADPRAGRVSNSSPIGQALLGSRPGDEVTVRAPSGEIRYRVEEVR